MNKYILLCFLFVFAANIYADGIVPANVDVVVRYQYCKKGDNEWKTSTVTLRGAVTEKAMIEAINKRIPDHMVRILSADPGPDKVLIVKYRVKDGNKWKTHTATMTNALTNSMAKNQVLEKNPDKRIRILSMKKKDK